MKPSRDISRLVEIMKALRDPVTGCPWDIEQTFSTIAPYTIEEAHEVADAIADGDMDELRDELGDLLLQVVYHARMAEEAGSFAFPDVVEAITAKMIRRHPHVFGDAEARAAGVAKGHWERIKAEEKRARGQDTEVSVLTGVPSGVPALMRAVKLQAKAASVGFEWSNTLDMLAKIREELDEVEREVRAGAAREAVEEEIGDLLFAVANLARKHTIDPDQALRRTNTKFFNRFRYIEEALRLTGQRPDEASLPEMLALWQAAKSAEQE